MLRIKICGVRTVADALAAAEAGADAIGLNFVPTSPRCIDTYTAQEILQAASVSSAAVVIDKSTLPSLPFDIVQTYAGRDESFAPALHLPAFRVRHSGDLASIYAYLNSVRHKPDAILIDGYSPQAHGGTGAIAPWQLLAGVDFGLPVVLAGGLTVENVAEAIRVVRPTGVDVASGVESAPGLKDRAKVRDFINAARAGFSIV